MLPTTTMRVIDAVLALGRESEHTRSARGLSGPRHRHDSHERKSSSGYPQCRRLPPVRHDSVARHADMHMLALTVAQYGLQLLSPLCFRCTHLATAPLTQTLNAKPSRPRRRCHVRVTQSATSPDGDIVDNRRAALAPGPAWIATNQETRSSTEIPGCASHQCSVRQRKGPPAAGLFCSDRGDELRVIRARRSGQRRPAPTPVRDRPRRAGTGRSCPRCSRWRLHPN